MEAIILAGGFGTRLGSLTKDRPKPMLTVSGRPFMEYLMDYWGRQGVTRFILAVGYRSRIFRSHFGNAYRDYEIAYSEEETPLGTGGGLLLALGKLEKTDDFLILNGDTYFEVPLEGFLRYHWECGADLTAALMRPVQAQARFEGFEIAPEGRIHRMVARERSRAGLLANGGVYLAKKETFSGFFGISEKSISFETEVLPGMLASGKQLYGFVCEKRFLDIGTPADYERAQHFF